ncbi:MAG: alpha-E domain-containing protein, partial [Gammaproteobacteria bacterium]|nr:alpha-E domain-containing protein [Gammaproteobacteria bacterium]
VANDRSSETLRRAGEIDASLQYSRIEDMIASGLRCYLSNFLQRNGDLGIRIASDFLVSDSTG